MSSPTDIREWGRNNGYDIADRGRVAADIVAAFNAEHGIDPPPEGANPPPSVVIGEPIADGDIKAKGENAPKPKVKRRRPSLRGRVSTERVGSAGWSVLANFFGGSQSPPGRMLLIQAPIAGMVIEDTVKGTVVDKVLQPLARASDKGEGVFGLLAPPILVTLMTRFPERQAALYPVLYAALESYVLTAGPKMKALKLRNDKLAEQLGEHGIDIHAMIVGLFEPATTTTIPQESAA